MFAPSSSLERPQTQEDHRPVGSSWSSTSPNNSVKSGSSMPSEAYSISSQHAGAIGEESGGVERHPKGKRKRTAAKDKEILESAYNANPKPDKAARLDIVARVSLSEKEVQIWFQNRRQNDRRKSRPLSPQEVAALRYGGMQILSSDPILCSQSSTADHEQASSPRLDLTSGNSFQSTTPLASPDLGPWLPGRFNLMPIQQEQQEPRVEAESRVRSPSAPSETSSQKATESNDALCNLSRSFPGAVGYLSNRWNLNSSFSSPASSFTQDSSQPEQSFAPSSCPSKVSAPILPPPNPQKLFRLSMSVDGKAEVINGKSPSPVRFQSATTDNIVEPIPLPQLRRPSLHRSHSALPSVTLPPISTLTAPWPSSRAGPPRLNRGRSRDVHAWEFAADVESREDELTAQANAESNGSAIAAISLLRSSSSISSAGILQPNGGKRNSPVAGRANAAKRAKLGRASSSIARLHSEPEKRDIENRQVDEFETDGKKRRKLKVTALLSPTGNDSDKENWSPDEDGAPNSASAHTRRPLPSAAQRSGNESKTTEGKGAQAKQRRTMGRVLQEQASGPAFLSSRANTAPAGRRGGKASALGGGGLEIFEDEENGHDGQEGDAEVEKFMRGEGINVSPSKKGDMDCIAGLLSLSQGAWR